MNPNEKDKIENDIIIEEKIVKISGETQIRQYIKGRQLGKGGFAKCYEFKNKETSKITAAKVIAKSTLTKSRAKQKLISEIKIHKALHHSNIVGFEHYFEDNENVYLLLEICNNQSMNELLKRRKSLAELEVQCYVSQIIKALKYLHSHRIIHRDLKLGNLFLTDKMEIKVGDFGLATKLDFDGERKKTVCGTPNYIAPEILEGKAGHSYEVDIWSLGVIIYTLLVGKPPFETNNVKETYKRIKANRYSFPEKVNISEEAKSIITEILVLDPLQRPSLDYIMQSDFFSIGTSIPKLLPTSTLACPPSNNYIKQFMPDIGFHTNRSKVLLKPKTYVEENAYQTERFKLQSQQGSQPIGSIVSLGENTTRPFTSTNNLNNNSQGIRLGTGVISAQKGNVGMHMISNDVWVKKWIDYSSKYGLGYILSNETIGVYFNDSTKILYHPLGNNFIYVERKPLEKIEIISTHLLTDDFNKDLSKKVVLLQHFHNYFKEDIQNVQINEIKSDKYNIDDANCIFVKKWIRTKHAILFRLSNKIVQVCFLDQTEIILSSETKYVTYVNKKGERLSFPLATALDSNNVEMTKRLRYTKDILTNMLSTHQGGNGNNNNE